MLIVNFLVTLISALAVGAATGLGLHLYGQMPPVLAGVSAAVIVMGLVEIYALAGRGRKTVQEHLKFNGLLKANAALSEEIVSLRQDMDTQKRALARIEEATGLTFKQRLEPIEASLEEQLEQINAIKAVNGELTEGLVEAGKRMGGLTKQVRRLDKRSRKPKPAPMAADSAPVEAKAPAEPMREPATQQAVPEPAPKPAETPRAAASAAPQQSAGTADPQLAEAVKGAITGGSADLYLQPIVTLPQRKVRYYEALTRLRGEDGTLMEPKDFMAIAERDGLVQSLDNQVLYRAVQVIRRLSERGRDVGLFCNLSPRSLIDSGFFNQMLEFLNDNRDLVKRMIFEFPQQMLDEAGPMEIESLRAMHEQGLRFSLDQVRSLNLDFQHMNDLGFRFVKVDADILLHRMEEADTWVHSADLSALMERHGISLIAEKVQSERTVLNLLDFDISLAQGHLFGKPAQVRMDIIGQRRNPAPLKMAV